MTFKRIQYETEEQKQGILSENSNLFLHETQILIEGKFLVFRDEPIPITPIYLIDDVNAIEQLKNDNLTTLEALAEVYEMLLAMQS